MIRNESIHPRLALTGIGAAWVVAAGDNDNNFLEDILPNECCNPLGDDNRYHHYKCLPRRKK